MPGAVHPCVDHILWRLLTRRDVFTARLPSDSRFGERGAELSSVGACVTVLNQTFPCARQGGVIEAASLLELRKSCFYALNICELEHLVRELDLPRFGGALIVISDDFRILGRVLLVWSGRFWSA